MKAIKVAAEAFLNGNVEPWISVAESIKQHLVDLAEMYEGNAYFVYLSGLPVHEIFGGAVDATFFDPEFIRKVASARTPRELRNTLTTILMDTAEEVSEELGTGEHIFYRRDPLLDVDEYHGVDVDEPVPWIPRSVFFEAVDEALENVKVSTNEVSILRPSDLIISELDLIDIALYNTLSSHPELARTLSWRTFERLLADLLEEFGFEVELTQGTKDGGIDVIAVKNETYFGVHRYLLQAKRWANKVGIEPVQRLLFLQSHYHATKSCLVTTSTFTSGAWQLADHYRWQLELRDFDGLTSWIRMARDSKRQRSDRADS
ncbi:MAG TPA: restriction endonuclease [Longimicrobium sp.]|jgi:hypothetical protein